MICKLNRVQQEATLKLMGRLVQVNKVNAPDKILRNVYDTVYESFVKKDMQKDAQPYALSMTQYAADNLFLLLESENEGIRQMVSKVAGTQYQFTSESIEKYKKEDELRSLLGLRENDLKAISSTVKKEDVQPFLDTVKKSFPPVKKRNTYVRSDMPSQEWQFPIAVAKDGTEVKLASVTNFLRNDRVQNNVPGDNVRINSGTLLDLTIRKYFNSSVSDYDTFRTNMLKDKQFTEAFRRFSENTHTPTTEIPSSVTSRYMEDYLKDMMYVINFIQSNYTDSYVTDFGTLIDNSSLTPVEKKKFYIYSAEIGLRGELDLIAIKKDGTFTVIDIKTTDGYTNKAEEDKHAKQASVYDLIIQAATGLKSSNTNDVIYLTRSITNPTKILDAKSLKGNYKISISNFNKKTNKNLDANKLVAEIQMYKKIAIDMAYDKVSSTNDSNKQVKPFTLPTASDMLNVINNRNKKGNNPTPLKQLFSPNDPLSTNESLRAGKTWIHQIFPELADRQVPIIRMINSPNGGEFLLDTITLYERSNEGVAYHEGWHRFSQLYMTKREKTNLYESVQEDRINFTTRDGRKLNTSDADFLDVEEFLAEEFRKYAQSPSTYTYPTTNKAPKSWFKKIWAAIKSIVNWLTKTGTFAPEELFSQLYTGSFNRTHYSTSNAIFKQLNSFFVDSVTGKTTLLDNITFLKFRDFSDHIIAQYLQLKDITIAHLLNEQGYRDLQDILKTFLIHKRDTIISERQNLAESIQDAEDELVREKMKSNDENLKFYQNTLDTILEQDSAGNYVKFADFMRAYNQTSKYETLRKFVGKNSERVNQLIDEENLKEAEKEEAKGEELSDFDGEPNQTEDNDYTEFNNPGNLKEAIENAKTELKDFFTGIPRRLNADYVSESSPELYEYDSGNLPVSVSKQEAFYKTLRVLSGSLTWDKMIERLNTKAYYQVFPELLTIKERLLGSSLNKGLLPKLISLTKLINNGEHTGDDVQEHAKLMSFLMHFAHVLSLRNVPFETFIIKLNYDPQKDEAIHTVAPLSTRDNLESIIYSIMNDFTKGFQINTRDRFDKSDKTYMNVHQALHSVLAGGIETMPKFMTDLKNVEYLYDPRYDKFYFNSLYLYSRYTTSDPTDKQMKNFFEYMGINLNEKIYENENDRAEVVRIYNKIRRDILEPFHRTAYDKLIAWSGSTTVVDKVKRWKAAVNIKSTLPAEATQDQKFAASAIVIDAENALSGYVNGVFSSNPVTQMLFDGRDRELMKDKKNKIFAANLPTFQKLAKVEKNYHKRFSSGTMLVLDKLQFSYFLPNNMLVTEMLINDHINHISDFAKYPELSHIDPVKNPQLLNSYLFGRIFDKQGNKIPNMKMGVSNISQLSVIFPDESVESKQMKDLKADEKLLYDFLMGISDGWTEIRRLETSNTAYRLSLTYIDGNERKYIKPLTFSQEDGFANPSFLAIVRNYIQHAAWKYQYNQNPDNRALDIEYEKENKGLDKLGVFDEMLPQSSGKIKTFIQENGGDMNTLMDRILKEDEDLFNKINDEVATYFENLTIKNDDSYKNVFNNTVSEKSKGILAALSNIQSRKLLVEMDHSGNLSDYLFRNFIANDFIQTMEDSLIFFGDYTYYKDPIKRRKIIGNNGSVNIVDSIMSEAIDAQKKANSINGIYQKYKGITSTKNNQLVRKAVSKEVKMTSSMLDKDENGDIKMLKDIQKLREQRFGVKISLEDLAKEKKETIDAFTDIEVGDAAAWISLDTYRQMRMREMTWDLDKDEDEYKRQILIHKTNLGEQITEDEQRFINRGPYSGFNVAKFAMTGAVYLPSNAPFKPSFDKMGLRVLLPSVDWNRSTRPIFEKMMEEDLDYIVFESGSKVYRPPTAKLFDDNAIKNVLNKDTLQYSEHAGGFFKYQQNTSHLNDKSTFSVQLRSIFYEIMLIQQKYGKVSPHLTKNYSKMIKSLSDYITINSSRSLTEMGLDIKGKITDKDTFVNYLKSRLLSVGTVDEDLISLLDTNLNGEFTTYLEALPFQKNIVDLIAGVIDDNFRRVKLNGTKFYQSPEIGTTITAKNIDKLPADQRGTIELKWHGLEFDSDGKIVSTTPVECKINFRDQFRPLLQLKHPDGQKISTVKRLNEAIQNKEWIKNNKESIMFIGVRIPLQDINFSSHIIVREFLPEEVGDMIILPPEFYKQTGSDNDIDTVTATFKYLDKFTGRPVKRPVENYEDIVARINELRAMKNEQPVIVVTDGELKSKLNDIRQLFIDNNVYVSRNKDLATLDREFTIVERDGRLAIAGLEDNNSLLTKLIKKGQENDLTDALQNFETEMNETPGKIKTPEMKELNALTRKRKNYIEGVTNDIVNSIIEFMEVPENFDFLTETDSITKIKEIAAENIARKTGRKLEDIKLADRQTSLQAMSYVMNLVNHVNNFQVRSLLGSIIKFRSILSLLSQINTVLQKEYTAGSMINLLAKANRETGFDDVMKTVSQAKDKTFPITVYTPLLYKKDTGQGIDLSIFDEDGQRITKNLSMLASSLLDLFKNVDVFPSLGITWLNVKPLIYLMATGVPMERAILFLNNPIMQEVQTQLDKLGSDAKDRHAIVATAQSFSGEEIFRSTDQGVIDYTGNSYNVMTTIAGGREVVNPMLGRPSKAGQLYLAGKYLTFSEETLTKFTTDYQEYLSNPSRTKYTKNLTSFLKSDQYKHYYEMAKDIMAYYATLWETGDNFYAYLVKGLNRNSAKMSSNSAIATAQATQKARETTGMVNPEFESRLKNETTHSPFYKDEIIENVLANTLPNILDNKDIYFRDQFKEMMRRLVSQTSGIYEEKRKVEMTLLSDFVEMIYKNFYIMNENGKGNTLYEMYQYDITPLLRPMVEGATSKSFAKFIDDFTKLKYESMSEDIKIDYLYSDSLFANQIEIFRAKYPELNSIKMISELMSPKEHGRDPEIDDMDTKDVLNMLSQSYITMNLSVNPKEREAEETTIRDDWKKLINFSLSQFPSIEAEIANNPTRLDFYQSEKNITEIRQFFKRLAYYSLAQSSHIEKSRGSFSYLAPPHIIKEVVETSINNFNDFLASAGSVFTDIQQKGSEESRKKGIDLLLKNFQKMFRDMNGNLKWQNSEGSKPKPVVVIPQEMNYEDGYEGDYEDEIVMKKQPKKKGKPYLKAHTGKLYSKMTDSNIDFFKANLAKKLGTTLSARNEFKIKLVDDQSDPLNCEL